MDLGFLFVDLLGKPAWMWLAFITIVVALLTFDLGVLHKESRATEVARWEVLAGDSADALQPVARARRDGFETGVSVPTTAPFVAVRALDAEGGVLGQSRAVRPRRAEG